ncbi:MAG TPA: hypothetical protein VFZ32_04205, partial [Micromonosporaceae bacterium]
MVLRTISDFPTWWRRHPDSVALALLSLVSFGISLRFAFAMPPLSGWDETAHAGYAIELMRGNLPRIDTWVVDDHRRFPQLSDAVAGWNPRGRQVWVANHPPLYYLLAVPFIALADWLQMPGAGLLAMRVLNAAGTAGSVAVVGLVARELVGRRSVMLLAAVLAASAGTLALQGGYGYNDGVAALAGGIALLLGVRLLRRGPSVRRLTTLALAATVAAGMKAPNLVTVAACAAMAGAAVLVHRPSRHLVVRALGACAYVGGAPALAFGWFYLRNLRLYGDLTGADVLLTGFQRRPRGSVLETVLSLGFHRRWFEEIWIRPTYDPDLRIIPSVLLAVAVLGLFLIGLDRLRQRPVLELPGAADSGGTRAEQRGLVLAWWILAAHFAVLLALLIQFHSAGGYVHRRYLLPILPLLATVLAVGLLRSATVLRHPDRIRWHAMVVLLLGTGMLLLPFLADGSSAVPVERVPKVPRLEYPSLGWPAPMLAVGVAALAGLC